MKNIALIFTVIFTFSSIFTVVEPSLFNNILSVNYTKCKELPKLAIFPLLLLLPGPTLYHFSLTPSFNCSKEFYSKTNGDLFDSSITGFVMRDNDIFQINTVKTTGTEYNTTYCYTTPRLTQVWYIMAVQPTLNGTISCSYACSEDGNKLAGFKCGATSNDPEVIKQELQYVEMVKYIEPENPNFKIFDAHSSCPKIETCP
ncbi:hypothetical protein CHUAL_004162 [Chamberlinius hualienensis]